MLQRLRMILIWLCAGLAVASFVTYGVLKLNPELVQPGLAATFRDYGATVTALFVFFALALAFFRQFVPPADEDGPPAGADDAAYQRYRVKGGLALVGGWAFVLVGGLDQLAHLGNDATGPGSWLAILGLVLLAIGSIYRYDLPNIYHRVSDLEDRLQRRIDALSNGHLGNGKGHVGNGADPDDEDESDDDEPDDDESDDEDESDDDEPETPPRFRF